MVVLVIISALWKLKQDDEMFEDSFDYIPRLSLKIVLELEGKCISC